ncbi:MAG: hypothetical protein HN909_04780 [Phycisphaerales bacterium]|jgi:hypothetical protein|nr:hypothetical protein [Phycisphaerales bacterium]MBT7171066.1 hypothetical protein [Phycisphaerales bacterium]
MESHKILATAVQEAGVKRTAADLGLSASLVYKWCAPALAEDDSGTRNPLDRVKALWDCTKNRAMIDWICRQAGGTFVEDFTPDADHMPENYIARTQEMIQGFSSLLDSMSAAMLNDGVVYPFEAEEIRDQWQELKQQAEGFVVACEKGLFR